MHEFEKQQKTQYEHWYKNSKTIVFLSVESLIELERLKFKLDESNVHYAKFCEPDLNNVLTSLCITSEEQAIKLCKNLPLGLSEFNKKGGQYA